MAGMGDVNEDLGYMEKLVKMDWGEGGAYGELEVLYIFWNGEEVRNGGYYTL